MFDQYPLLKKLIGVLLILVGLLALVTPFTPGSWLIFVGLGWLGFQMAFWQGLKKRSLKELERWGIYTPPSRPPLNQP